MREKMIPAFAQAQGGLFAAVEKADVGNAYQEMERQGIALMGWADPFMPDFSMPEAVEQAVARLPPLQREAIVLHYFDGFTPAEIARMTDTPLSTVRWRLNTAKHTLAQWLKEEEHE